MKIEHVINNNIVSSMDGGNEIVISGRGIGFGAHKGDVIDEKRIEKIYRMDSKEQMGKFKQLLISVSPEYLKISDEIITQASRELNVELNSSIYMTLTDHISFAIERYGKGMDFDNILTNEVSDYYPNEFRIGMNAVKLIKEETGCNLKRDEAASIALHIVSAELNTKMSVAYGITEIVKGIMDILRDCIDTEDKESQVKLEDVIYHIKHLAYRIISDKQYQDEDVELYRFVQEHYPAQCICCDQIDSFISEVVGKRLTVEERNHLVMNLKYFKFAS